MDFHANYLSISVCGDGDYYQATFQVEQDGAPLTERLILVC
jgi:hypothetical protein